MMMEERSAQDRLGRFRVGQSQRHGARLQHGRPGRDQTRESERTDAHRRRGEQELPADFRHYIPPLASRIMAFSASIGQNSRARGVHMKGRPAVFALVTCGWMAVAWSSVQSSAPQGAPGPVSSTAPDIKATLDRYCITCHSQRLATAGVVLEGIDTANPVARAELWERVITKLRARSMPPAGPGAGHRSRLAGEAESRTDQRGPSSQSDRIQQRDPRSVRARRRRDAEAAGR
ncbi:MAG: hypothetical protein DMF88_14820 [Acidobacteria bacterium]|nr:MAG: hypothetical protein DMF88_14820 [Acidobacteriota bacterium]